MAPSDRAGADPTFMGFSLGSRSKEGYKSLPTTDDPEASTCPSRPTTAMQPQASLQGLADGLTEEGSPLGFVLAGWFQSLSALCIIANLIAMLMELDDPAVWHELFWPNQALLCFYIFELLCRILLFRGQFFFGAPRLVAWNILDTTVVVAGVIDQWLILLFQPPGWMDTFIGAVRFLRVIRVLRILRLFLEADLSWTEEPRFQSFIGIVILFNGLLMGVEMDVHWFGWFWIEQVLLSIYVFELMVVMKRQGFAFFSFLNADAAWNYLDLSIVLSSMMDLWVIPVTKLVMQALIPKTGNGRHSGLNFGQIMMLLRMLRLMRILRLVRLVRSVRPLFMLVTGVLAALQGVMWVLVLTIVTLYAMGILATQLIGHKMMFPADMDVSEEVLKPFVTVSDSMFTLFRVMSGAPSNEESQAIDELMKALPTVKFAFVFFMVTSSWTLLSILTAVVSENMISSTGQQEEMMKLAQWEEDRETQIDSLMQLFGDMDKNKDGTVDKHEMARFLADDALAQKTAALCQVPRRDIRRVFDIVSQLGTLNLAHFVECLADLSTPVTEKSMMKLESHLRQVTRTLEELQGSVQVLQDDVLKRAAVSTFHDGASAMRQEEMVERAAAAAMFEGTNARHQKEAAAVCTAGRSAAEELLGVRKILAREDKLVESTTQLLEKLTSQAESTREASDRFHRVALAAERRHAELLERLLAGTCAGASQTCQQTFRGLLDSLLPAAERPDQPLQGSLLEKSTTDSLFPAEGRPELVLPRSLLEPWEGGQQERLLHQSGRQNGVAHANNGGLQTPHKLVGVPDAAVEHELRMPHDLPPHAKEQPKDQAQEQPRGHLQEQPQVAQPEPQLPQLEPWRSPSRRWPQRQQTTPPQQPWAQLPPQRMQQLDAQPQPHSQSHQQQLQQPQPQPTATAAASVTAAANVGVAAPAAIERRD